MDAASVVPPHPRVPSTTSDTVHSVLRRRSGGPRALRRRRARLGAPIRDAFETWRRRTAGVRLTARLTTVALATLATADLIADAGPIRQASWIAAVLLAGAGSLLAVAAAETAGVDQSRRWHLQAVASAVIMFMLMANAMQQPSGDGLWILVVVGAASTLVAMATPSLGRLLRIR